MAGINQASLFDRMITQEWSAAINNGFATGSSNLTTAIDRTKPYWVIQNGSIYGSFASSANPGVVDGMTDDDTVHCIRSSGSTTGDAAVYGIVVGVRKA